MKPARISFESPPFVTTVGDLVVAVMDEALEVIKDERKAYQVAGVVLNKLLKLSKPISTVSSGSIRPASIPTLQREPFAGWRLSCRRARTKDFSHPTLLLQNAFWLWSAWQKL